MTKNYEVKVKYTKQQESGDFKRVTEPYLVAAMTFGDAETRIYEELGALIRGEFEVTAIKAENFHDISRYDDSDIWYSSVLEFDSSEEGGKSKKTKQNLLVTASSVKEAFDRFVEMMSGMMVDFEIKSVKKTELQDVFPIPVEVDLYADNN